MARTKPIVGGSGGGMSSHGVNRHSVPWARVSRLPKMLVLALVLLLGAAACGKQAAPPPPMAVDATFAVDGMTCALCTVTVRTAAKGVNGVYDARADVQRQRAWVSYDAERTNPAIIAAAITRAGYKATPTE